LSLRDPRVGQDPYGGVTVDQIRGRAHRSGHARCPSLEVATEGRGGGGACDRNYGCSYGATISFRTPTTPLPMESDPRKLFERLFGQGDTAQERTAIRSSTSSILDLGDAGGRRSAEDARRARSRQARRLPRERARDRAAGAEDGGSRICPASICPTCRSDARSISG
jgi:hypothetical protein